MVLKARYQEAERSKDFYISYSSNSPDYVKDDPTFLETIYPHWKKKFEDLDFLPLSEEVFKEMFVSLITNQEYISSSFSVYVISIDK